MTKIRVLIVAALAALVSITAWAQNTVKLTNTQYNAESTGNVLTMPFVTYWQSTTCEAGGPWGADWAYHTIATDAPTPTCRDSSPTNSIGGVLDFDDAATEYIYRTLLLPSDWTGAIALVFVWDTSAITGNVVWQAQTFCNAVGEAVDESGFTYNTANTVTDAAQGTTFRLNTATISSLTTTGCAAGELFHLKVFRNPANASDTIAATASLHGVEMTARRAI